MSAGCICQHTPDPTDLETERRRRIECKGQPREKICREKQRVLAPGNQKSTASSHTGGKEPRRIDAGLSRPPARFSARLIIFGVGQIIKNAYITRADDKRGQRKRYHRPQRWTWNS